MNQKGFANIILIVIVVAIIAVSGYFVFVKKSKPVTKQSTPVPTPNSETSTPVNETSESEVLESLKTNWQTVQLSIPFRPGYHNQAGEDANKIWYAPNVVQFIGKNNILLVFEDDNNPHIAIFKFDNGKFNLLEVFKYQAHFSLSDWQDLVNKYGDSSYSISTYTTGLVRNKQLISFTELTKVSENIFIENYWEQ